MTGAGNVSDGKWNVAEIPPRWVAALALVERYSGHAPMSPSRTKNRPVISRPAAADDRRQRVLDAALKRTGFRQDALIEVLHAAQNAFGYLTPELLWYVAASLKLPASRVFGVATFYNFFSLQPPGAHTVILCEGTVCYLHGARHIGEALAGAFGAAPGTTSPDGQVSVAIARCFGSCALAPVLMVDGQIVGNSSPEAAVDRVRAALQRSRAEAIR